MVVVGTDTDILVMLVAQATTNMDVYMLCWKNLTTLYRVRDIQDSFCDTSTYLMVLHAITGCDTVSAQYRQGKCKAFNLVHKNKTMVCSKPSTALTALTRKCKRQVKASS